MNRLRTAGAIQYALNGTQPRNSDFANIDSIWAANPDIPGTKVNISPLIARALALR